MAGAGDVDGALPAERANLVGLVVVHLGDRQAADAAWRTASERRHQLVDSGQALTSLQDFVDELVAVVADVDEEVVQVFEDGLLAILDGGGQLGEEQGSHGGVLVAGVGSFEVSVRFLEREEEAMGPSVVDSFGRSI